MTDRLDLAALLDREAIRDCIHRCALANDMRDSVAWKAAYWPDALEDHPPLFCGNAHAFVDAMIDLLDTTMESVWHQFSGTIIRIDGASARTISYAHAHVRMKANDDTPAFILRTGLRYLDRLEKRAGEWRIAHRLTKADWVTQTPATAPIVDMGEPAAMHAANDPAKMLFPEGIPALLNPTSETL